MNSITQMMQQVGKQAKDASGILASASTEQKNQALAYIAEELVLAKQDVLTANAQDMQQGRNNNLESALLDRLEITDGRFDDMLQGLTGVQQLPDPVGEMTDFTYRPSGIQLGKMRVPLGVVGMIYESRPNVTVEAASLAIKSGNGIILRGGSEAFYSNQAIANCIKSALKKANLPETCVQVIETTDRQAVGELITMTDYVDVVIPRGGKGLIARISNDARVPVIKHLDGNCHTYVDNEADKEKAIPIVVNAKTHRYGTCNTMETLLVHTDIATDFIKNAVNAMLHVDSNMEFVGCEHSQKIMPDTVLPATELDWETEYLAPKLAIKVVNDIEEAIAHINKYGSQHTDVILTENYTKSRQFIQKVDSASVMINASSRFADGFEYGLGAEIGISTDKIHARGPVGLHGLTSQKWIVFGNGNIRQ